MGPTGGNPSDADAIVTALNLCAYHVTFNLYDDDYDARNPRYNPNTAAFGPGATTRAAAGVVFRRKTGQEEGKKLS